MEYNCADAQYFLARIKGFEKAYGMESWKFRFLYENESLRRELPGYNGRSAVDYSEWAFLCENLSDIDSALYESPPCSINIGDQQRPEEPSGLCFTGCKGDRRSSSVFRAHPAHALG